MPVYYIIDILNIMLEVSEAGLNSMEKWDLSILAAIELILVAIDLNMASLLCMLLSVAFHVQRFL